MTAIRKSIVFGFEDEFGMGLGAGQHWFAPPPGSFISHTHNRSTNRVNATGSKKYDFIAYGKYSGTWDWSFYLDYEYLEPLKLMFEKEVNNGHKYYPPNLDYTYINKVTDAGAKITGVGGALPRENLIDGSLWVELPSGTNPGVRVRIHNGIFPVEGSTTREYFVNVQGGGDDGWIIVTSPIENPSPDDIVRYLARPSNSAALSLSYSIHTQTVGIEVTAPFEIGEEFEEGKAYVLKDGDRLIDNVHYTPSIDYYEHILKKINEGRVPSMVIRIVTLNRMAGGELDEILEVRGCVCKSMRFSNSAGSSQWGVSLSGFCTREVMWLGRLAHTDYRKHDGELTQFACLFTGAEANKDTYVANCDSIQIAIENNAEVLDSTCTPFSPWYFEQITNYQFSASVYSFDPMLFKQRLYAGGQSLEQITGKKNYTNDGSEMDELYHDSDLKKDMPPGVSEAITDDGKHVKYLTTPLCKKLAPAKDFLVVTYDACRNDMAISPESTDTLMDAIDVSKNRIQFHFTDVVIKALSWQRGDQQKIMDSLSSAECWEIDVTVRTDRSTIINPNNYITPIGPVYNNQTRKWIDPSTGQEANTNKLWT